MKTKFTNQSIENAVTEKIRELLAVFTGPQPTQTIYFDLLCELQGAFHWVDRWQLRFVLLIAIAEARLAADESDIRELFAEAMANRNAESYKNAKYINGNN